VDEIRRETRILADALDVRGLMSVRFAVKVRGGKAVRHEIGGAYNPQVHPTGRRPVSKFDRITSDPEILNGQPCIRGMRLSVRRIVQALSVCRNREELLAEYPELEDEDVDQALAFAAANLDDGILDLPRAS